MATRHIPGLAWLGALGVNVALAISGLSPAARAATHYVNVANPTPVAPYTNWATASTNIQFAINLAGGSGGLVLVTNGVYTGPGKSIGSYGSTMLGVTNGVTLRSVNGPAVTIINGLGDKRGLIMSNALVEGFTITNCVGGGFLAYKGGGGALVAGNGRLVNCILTGNSGPNFGGGAAVFNGGQISNCIVRGNRATTAGGGICMYEGGLVVDCLISNNLVSGVAGARGGGVGCEVGGVVSNCAILNNTSHCQGGGISIFTNGLARDCFIAGNIANSNGVEGEGGGAYLHQGGSLVNCVISNNFGQWQGGGVKFYYRNGRVRNCLLVGNRTLGWGGGLMMRTGGRAENCTIVGNYAADTGGGVYFYEIGGSNVNCIIRGNNGNDLANPYVGALAFCCIPLAGFGPGNITNEPAFADADGGDYRLANGSPCVNAGSNELWMGGATDLDGNDRIRNLLPDMGAYESAWWRADTDTDGDSFSDWTEANVTGTDPTNAASFLKMSGVAAPNPGGGDVVVSWASVAGKLYNVNRATNLVAPPAFTPIQTGVTGQPDCTSITDTTATAEGPYYYRVEIGP